MTKQYLQMVRYKMSFTILISQAVLYQENISKADQNCVSGFAYISIESIQKEKEQPMGEKDITEKLLEDYNDVSRLRCSFSSFRSLLFSWSEGKC